MLPSKSRRGFTLIELLVVVSIIALLMSILLPSLGKAKEQGQRVVCKSNLQQICIMARMYDTNEFNSWPYQSAAAGTWFVGSFMTPNAPSNWIQLLQREMLNNAMPVKMFVCPTSGVQNTAWIPGSTPAFDVSYSANGVLTTLGNKKLPGNDATIEAFADEVNITQYALLRPHWGGTVAPAAAVAGWTGYNLLLDGVSSATSQPHNVGQNFSFLDGHAEYVKPNDNSSAKYGLYVGGQDVHEVAGQFATLP